MPLIVCRRVEMFRTNDIDAADYVDGENAYQPTNQHTHTRCTREMLISFRLRMSVSLFRYGSHSSASRLAHDFPEIELHSHAQKLCVSFRLHSAPYAVCTTHLTCWTGRLFGARRFYAHLQRYRRRSAWDFGVSDFRYENCHFPSCSIVPSGRKEIHSNWSHFLSFAASAAAVAYAMR